MAPQNLIVFKLVIKNDLTTSSIFLFCDPSDWFQVLPMSMETTLSLEERVKCTEMRYYDGNLCRDWYYVAYINDHIAS